MNFIQRVKAVFNGKKAKHAPAVPPSVPKAKKPHAEKPPHGARPEKKNPRANDPAVVRGGPHKKRKPHAAPEPPRRHHGAPPRDKGPSVPWDPASYQVAEAEGKTRFPDLDLPEVLLHALCDLDFRYCTPIQAKSLPLSLDGADVCGRAQTGTGKTAAFLLTVFKHLLAHPAAPDRRKGYPRALIMAPTRELCMQIARDAGDLGAYTGLRTLAVYGGMDMQEQRAMLRDKHVDVVVATPGRLLPGD